MEFSNINESHCNTYYIVAHFDTVIEKETYIYKPDVWGTWGSFCEDVMKFESREDAIAFIETHPVDCKDAYIYYISELHRCTADRV